MGSIFQVGVNLHPLGGTAGLAHLGDDGGVFARKEDPVGLWNNHRHRQAGKYAKQLAKAVEAQQQQIMALQAQQAAVMAPAAQPAAAAPQPGLFQEGYNRGWTDGWKAGQADLIRALRAGELRLEDL